MRTSRITIGVGSLHGGSCKSFGGSGIHPSTVRSFYSRSFLFHLLQVLVNGRYTQPDSLADIPVAGRTPVLDKARRQILHDFCPTMMTAPDRCPVLLKLHIITCVLAFPISVDVDSLVTPFAVSSDAGFFLCFAFNCGPKWLDDPDSKNERPHSKSCKNSVFLLFSSSHSAVYHV